jgi:U2 small nuclear ribonucleoprotein B''
VAKLDGTYKMPGSAAANVELTEIQQNIFNAPAPGTTSVRTTTTSHGLPAKPAGTDADTANRGQKRTRDEEEDDESDEDVAMAMDSDDDDE